MFEKFYIYESELCAIAHEASIYPECETGGDLFGLWTADRNPVVFLATGPGEKAIHQETHYQMDIEYERDCQTILMEQFGIHYLGDWHSHHKLGIYEPSIQDKNRIQQLFFKNPRVIHMAEIIVNHSNELNKKEIISGYIYNKIMTGSDIICLKSKNSPIREKLMYMQEEKYFHLSNKKLPLEQIYLKKPGTYIKRENHNFFKSSNKMKEEVPLSIKIER